LIDGGGGEVVVFATFDASAFVGSLCLVVGVVPLRVPVAVQHFCLRHQPTGCYFRSNQPTTPSFVTSTHPPSLPPKQRYALLLDSHDRLHTIIPRGRYGGSTCLVITRLSSPSSLEDMHNTLRIIENGCCCRCCHCCLRKKITIIMLFPTTKIHILR